MLKMMKFDGKYAGVRAYAPRNAPTCIILIIMKNSVIILIFKDGSKSEL